MINFSFGVCCVSIIGEGSAERSQNMHGKAHSFSTYLNKGSKLTMVNYNVILMSKIQIILVALLTYLP